MDIESLKGKLGCPLCNGTGTVTDEFGVSVECECVKELADENFKQRHIIAEPEDVVTPNIYGELTVDDKIRKMNLIPAGRMDDNYDSEHVRIVAMQMCAMLKKTINKDRLQNYITILDDILTGLRSRRLPKKSYLIGSNNGFGKTTFANTAIKIMASNGMKAVPYITLTELAEKWADAQEMLAARLDDSRKKLRRIEETPDMVETETGEDVEVFKNEYDWHDYVKADLAIVAFTSVREDTMWIEALTLKQLLTLRSARGLATIVTISNSLDWYMNSERVSKYIMGDILETQDTNALKKQLEKYSKSDMYNSIISLKESRLDKLEHISTNLAQIKD